MIPTNELRIGNWVLIQGDEQKQIKTLQQQHCTLYDDGFDWHRYDAIHPIPLTPEVLVKCGFVVMQSGHYSLMDENIWLSPNKHKGWNYYVSYSSNTGELALAAEEIESLHRLQNVLHALEEVEITYVP